LPVVVSRVGGMVELVDHLESGMLFRSSDSKDLASKIKTLLFDRKLQQKVIKNALKKTAEPVFDCGKNLENIKNISRQLGS
jgi:glycosyltransferase involved in cell wall biosynthesis